MKQWLTPDDIAQELGVPVETVRFWIKRKERPLPAYRPGRNYLIKREDLDKFLEQSRITDASIDSGE
jgi:excisionase family DNA binding protein